MIVVDLNHSIYAQSESLALSQPPTPPPQSLAGTRPGSRGGPGCMTVTVTSRPNRGRRRPRRPVRGRPGAGGRD